MTDSEIDKLYQKLVGPGPQTFKPDYKLTEKRADIGVPTIMKDTNEKKEDPIDERLPLYPNKNAILPRKLTFKYYKPSTGL